MTDWLTPDEWPAVALSLRVSLWATFAALPLGIATAYALARWDFRGKQLLNGIVHLPLILPPVVTGYLLLLSFGRHGPIGQVLDGWFGLVFAFRWTGAALAAGVNRAQECVFHAHHGRSGPLGNGFPPWGRGAVPPHANPVARPGWFAQSNIITGQCQDASNARLCQKAARKNK